MSKDQNISNLEQGLRELFSSAEVPAPEGVWDALESNLDAMQSDIHFDQSMRDGLQNANITPPTQIWQAVQQGMGWANGGGFWASLAGKWIIGIGSAAIITTSTYLIVDSNKESENLEVNSIINQVEETSQQKETSHLNEYQKGKEENQTIKSESSSTARSLNLSAPNETESDVPSADIHNDRPPQTVDGPSNNPRPQNAEQLGIAVPGLSIPQSSSSDRNTDGGHGISAFALSFSSRDTILCDGTSYKIRITNSDHQKLLITDNGEELDYIQAGQFIEISDLSLGKHELVFKARSEAGILYKYQTLIITASPKAELQVQAWEGGKYTFILDTREPLKYSWFLDGLFKQEQRVWETKFSDTKVKEHAICAVFKNEQGCMDSVRKTFVNEDIIKLLEPKKADFFTPNYDGYGDIFKLEVAGQSYWHMSIFDNQKKLVFETFDAEKGWNGKNQYSGQECSTGQYICVLEYEMTGGERKKMTWLVTLSR